MSSQTNNRAVIYRRFGRPEVLEIVDDWPMPELEANDVLIKMAAVSINPKDTLLRKGKFSKWMAKKPLPRATAMDGAGEVVAVGESVRRFAIGDRVFAMSNEFTGGMLCDFVALSDDELAVIPGAFAIEAAAAMPLAALTALQALRDCGACGTGSRVLIIGAAGGVGHFATQIATILGAQVTGVCSQANANYVASLGATQVLDYNQQKPTLIDAQFDIVFDVVGYYQRKQFASQLGKQGVFISTVPKPASIFGELLNRLRLSRTNRLVIVKSKRKDLKLLADWVQADQLTPTVSHQFSINDIQAAHETMQEGHTRGKIIVSL